MAHNPNRRRGLYRKPHARQKPSPTTIKRGADVAHTGFYPYLLRFIEWGAIRGLSDQTARSRERALIRFIAWCDDYGLDEPKELTKPILERYQKHLYYYRKRNGEPLSFGSQHALLAPLKAFFKWLAKENYLPSNPASELELPKQQRGLPKSILSIEEVERIFETVDTSTPYGIRDRAMLETLYSTGIRRMELVNLGLYDVDAGRKTLLVRQGKGRKDRLLPVGERALQWIERYRHEVRSQLVVTLNEPHLFLTDYGEPWAKNRLSEMVKKYFYHAQIDKPGACHLFRHAMATHMLENGADIRFIQAMLGHSDLSTTQIYTQVSIEKLREIHTATHPAKLEDKAALLSFLAAEDEQED